MPDTTRELWLTLYQLGTLIPTDGASGGDWKQEAMRRIQAHLARLDAAQPEPDKPCDGSGHRVQECFKDAPGFAPWHMEDCPGCSACRQQPEPQPSPDPPNAHARCNSPEYPYICKYGDADCPGVNRTIPTPPTGAEMGMDKTCAHGVPDSLDCVACHMNDTSPEYVPPLPPELPECSQNVPPWKAGPNGEFHGASRGAACREANALRAHCRTLHTALTAERKARVEAEQEVVWLHKKFPEGGGCGTYFRKLPGSNWIMFGGGGAWVTIDPWFSTEDALILRRERDALAAQLESAKATLAEAEKYKSLFVNESKDRESEFFQVQPMLSVLRAELDEAEGLLVDVSISTEAEFNRWLSKRDAFLSRKPAGETPPAQPKAAECDGSGRIPYDAGPQSACSSRPCPGCRKCQSCPTCKDYVTGYGTGKTGDMLLGFRPCPDCNGTGREGKEVG